MNNDGLRINDSYILRYLLYIQPDYKINNNFVDFFWFLDT